MKIKIKNVTSLTITADNEAEAIILDQLTAGDCKIEQSAGLMTGKERIKKQFVLSRKN